MQKLNKSTSSPGPVLQVSETEVGTAIDKLNNGKAADEYGLSAEDFKIAKPMIDPVLARLFN